MSKEKLKQADDWLKSMKSILSDKTDHEDFKEVKQKVELFEWLVGQAQELEKILEDKNV